MRRAVTICALAAVSLGVGSHAAPTSPAASGLDHLDHKIKVAVSGVADLACSACHQTSRRGLPTLRYDHTTCFARCHGGQPRKRPRPDKLTRQQSNVCRVCHEPGQLTRAAAGKRMTSRPKSATSDPEHAIRLPHDQHAAIACQKCHSRNARHGPHDRCATCHLGNRASTPIRDCQSCHVAQVGKSGPTLTSGPYSVAKRFAHETHDAHTKANCTACHGNITRASGDDLAAPAKSACVSCHDGRVAFSTLGPSCSKCHAPSKMRRPPWTTAANFDHAKHQQTCISCHKLRSDSNPEFLTDVHETCAGAGCHRSEFSSPKPRICTVCHAGSEPWRHLHSEPLRSRSGRDYSVSYDHALHQASDSSCTSCHPTDDGSINRPSHSGCSKSGCHQLEKGPSPTMLSCSGCHVSAIPDDGPRPWSVAKAFRHAEHARDKSTDSALPCIACHAASRLDGSGHFRPPEKAQCSRCHDGKLAFKLTGHDCRRCHTGL